MIDFYVLFITKVVICHDHFFFLFSVPIKIVFVYD